MTILTPNKKSDSDIRIGGKANNLRKLESLGIKVPRWAVVPASVVLQQLPATFSAEEAEVIYSKLTVPSHVLEELSIVFKGKHHATFAVRSSALDEDGNHFSFAGQFETFLHVPYKNIEQRIRDVWCSAVAKRVVQYRQKNGIEMEYGIGVIVQEMVHPEVSGVAFGANPISNSKDCKVISAVYGLGEGLVSGVLDADTFSVYPDKITSNIAIKNHAFFKRESGSGITKRSVIDSKKKLPTLNNNQLKEITDLLEVLDKELGHPQDIEFAYANNSLFLLQTRPITTYKSEEKGAYILWDNSNIIESYPGITTPLTFSFILKMYEKVYRQFVSIMGVKEKEINRHSAVFANTLGLVRGRVYYNLLNWYKMLAMLPGYSINAENMERMMGVKERFELDDTYQLSKGKARLRILGMVFKMIGMQRKLPKERRKFLTQLQEVMNKYKAINFNEKTPLEILKYYTSFEQSLLLKWKAPLINDFFAMIWFGLLEKQTKKLCPKEINIHNNLLCGSQDIISVEPIYRSIDLAEKINANPIAKKLFLTKKPKEIWSVIVAGSLPKIKKDIDNYIDLFGERCVGELKLETISYAQNPALFVKIIKSYVVQGITQKSIGTGIEEELREQAEKTVFAKLKIKPLKRWWFKYILNKTRDLVSNRENLRYERTRAFGMVRNMFSALGVQWHKQNALKNPRDIFYLELAEIKSMLDGQFKKSFLPIIKKRKADFEQYKTQPIPQERFYTYGNIFTDEYIYSLEKIEDAEEDLQGIGCCPGIVQGKVKIVTDPNEIDSLDGDILVTTSTDPGWVTLFPTASAIIVERGSLLSHSAIVSREMGIPCIVSVKGLLRSLKTGDTILMDGSTGKIKQIKND